MTNLFIKLLSISLVIFSNILYNVPMTSFILKIIAMATMVVDHFGDVYFKQISWMNLIGRIAFPIFAFQISEGYLHTKNLKKYFLRLFLFALVSQLPFMLFYSLYINTPDKITLNIFFTLLAGLLAIFLYDKIHHLPLNISKIPKANLVFTQFLSFFAVICLGALAQVLHFDYGFFGIAIIFLFYLFRENKIAMSFSFITACLLKYGIPYISSGFNPWYIVLTAFTILPIIFICFYNKKQGKKVKYLLYLFYPVHLLILYFLFR